MYIVHVHVHIKLEYLEDFKNISIENAQNSLLEPGIVRFDVLQQADDPSRFELIEIYRAPEDAGRHKETAHYEKWRNKAEKMMAEPRTRTVYTTIFPS